MKILLVCGAGASSGFMAQNMRKAAKKREMDIEIIARSEAELTNNVKDADILLVGPHLEYNIENIQKAVEPYGIPFAFINKEAYGSMDGEAALTQALTTLEEFGGVKKKTEEVKKEPVVKEESQEKGFFAWMNNSFAPKLNKICGNPYIRSIQESIMSILPMIMIGSVASIVDVLRSFEIFAWIPDISMLNTFSFGLIAVFLAFLLPYKIMEKKGNEKLKISCTVTSVALFFIIIMPTFDGDAGTINFVKDLVGTGGMLVSVVVGIFSALIFDLASKYSFFKKDTVMPDIVVNWIDALIPVTVCLAIGIAIYNSGFNLSLAIRSIFAPVSSIGQTLPGMILCYFITVFLYSFGFTWIFFPIIWAIWMDGLAANAAAVAVGAAATNLNLMETFMGMMYIGGQGATLTLVFLMMFSKSKRLKAIGRVTLFPSIFNINEPVVFGAPVVWNPILMIPMWLNSIILPIVMYILFKIGMAPVPSSPMQMWYIPTYIQAYFSTGSIGGVLIVIILTIVSFFIWLPFFKAYEKQEVEKEYLEQLEKEK